jgi:hypothetical protein
MVKSLPYCPTLVCRKSPLPVSIKARRINKSINQPVISKSIRDRDMSNILLMDLGFVSDFSGQISVVSGQCSVVSGQWSVAVVNVQCSVFSMQLFLGQEYQWDFL